MAENTTKVRYVTFVGMLVNLFLSAIKLIIGWVANSQALIADGVHSVSDLATDAAIIIGAKIWNAPADKNHPYGHGRFETIINIGISVALLSVGLGIGWSALSSIGVADETTPGWSAFTAALISIATKEILFRWTANEGNKLNSRAVVANAWHHRSDALSSVPVAAAVAGSHLFPELQYLDHIAALFVTLMIINAAKNIAWPSFREILEMREDEELEKRIEKAGKTIPDISEIHAIRSRRVGAVILVDLHMLVNPDMSVKKAHDLAESFKLSLLAEESELADVIIHIEPEDESEEK